MDCNDARDLLVCVVDGETRGDERARVLEHVRTCAECESFARALVAVGKIPKPVAPVELADRIVAVVAAEADARRAAEELATAEPAPVQPVTATAGTAAVVPAWLTRTRLWTATAAVTLAAAAIAVAVLVNGQGGGSPLTASKAVDESARDTATAGVGGTTAPSTAQAGAPATVPDYVAFDSVAYVAAASTDVTGSALTTIGATQTAMRGAGVMTVPVLRASLLPDAIVLAVPGTGYQAFTPVTRQLAGRTFRLATGPLDRYGLWPTLPDGWSVPTAADGSPYYRPAGTDALGVSVFVRIGQTPDLGFLVPPGTAAGDPAAGNPGWTLWLPAE